MTITSEIIKQSFRESNMLALGATPTVPQSDEALSMLSRLISGVYGYDVGENLEDWPIGISDLHPHYRAGYWNENRWRYLEVNSRVIFNQTESQTLYLPMRPRDGSRIQALDVTGDMATYPITINGNGRLIGTAEQVVLNTDGVNITYIYNASIGTWVTINPIDINGEMPFPIAFDDYFIIKLASRLNPRYGRSLSTESIARLNEMTEQMESTYRQSKSMPAQPAVLHLSTPREFRAFTRGPRGWMS